MTIKRRIDRLEERRRPADDREAQERVSREVLMTLNLIGSIEDGRIPTRPGWEPSFSFGEGEKVEAMDWYREDEGAPRDDKYGLPVFERVPATAEELAAFQREADDINIKASETNRQHRIRKRGASTIKIGH